jgi:2-polyprenyl-3-methyl-5-hydroxy-6-metoxy-1,4-benzoquinol methylase
MMPSSPITGSPNTTVYFKLDLGRVVKSYLHEYDIDVSEYFKGMTELTIFKCPDTGYRFFHPESLVGKVDLYRSLLRVLLNHYQIQKWEYQRALLEVNNGDRLLDVGCGTGSMLAEASLKGAIVTGLESNPDAVEIAKTKGLNVLSESLASLSSKFPGSFDIVTSFQVLEHVYDVKDFLNHAIKLLKPRGKLIIGVPNNNPFLYAYDIYHTLNLPPHHVGMWDKFALANLENFFEIKVKSIQVEPLKEFSPYGTLLSRHYLGEKMIPQRLHFLNGRLFAAIANFFRLRIDGRNLLGVYEKR